MSLALETVVKHLADSGIVAPGKLENFVPPKASPKDAEELLRELYKQNLLTKFQAQQVAAGKAKALILGNYTILDKIGAGGMGQVFKAEHRRMKRLVAIKMLPPAMTKDAAALARFQREVEAAAKLEHPNIVHANDADQAGNTHFLVMQYVEGKDLSALVKKDGPLPVDMAVNYILQAARGLEYAHKRGVIHRDIKPANLLLDYEGTVKILDMGLARIDTGGNAPTQAELTGTGAVMGTVDYMAPEQARSTHHADARADIYSLGCSLFYLLTARPLYNGDTVTAKLISHQFDPIPTLGDIRPDVPPDVQAVYEKMIAKRVEDRYQAMTEVIADLQACGMGPGGGMTMVSGTQVASSSPLSNSNLSFLKDAAATHTVQRTTHKHTQAAKPTTAPARRVPKRGVLIGAGVLGIVLLLGAIIVLLKTNDGTLIVEVDQMDATVQVLDEEGKVEVSQKGGAGKVTISVDPGKHRLKVEKDGFAVFGQEFEMEKRGTKAITAKLVPLVIESPIQSAALAFDGASSHVLTPVYYDGNGALTVECFCTPRNSTQTARLISNKTGKGIGGFALSISEKDRRWAAGGSHGKRLESDTVLSGERIQLNSPAHIAAVYDTHECRLYVDGTLSGRISLSQIGDSPSPFILGASRAGKSKDIETPFDGIIDEVRISKVARYTGNFTPKPRFTPDADTIALYHFDEGSGDTAFDSSANKHHAKIVGAKWVRAGSLGGSQSTTPIISGPAPPLAIAPFDAKQARAHQEAWASYLGKQVETPNSVGMKMVLIPPGEFMMGSTDEQVEAALKVADQINADTGTKGRIATTERPQHKVIITRPFMMSATEVTVGQFKKFATATRYQSEAERQGHGKSYLNPGYVVSDDSPATYVTWDEAMAYCTWLSEQEEWSYRLPTEAEWEYACRAGTTTQYCFGDDHIELPKYGWHTVNSEGRPCSVGRLSPNNFGLFDMHGNLMEWCSDFFNAKWYEATSINDPICLTTDAARVLRGGVYNYPASACRAASRQKDMANRPNGYSGFRCVSVMEVLPASATTRIADSSPKLFMHDPAFPQWMAQVQAMPAEEQIKAVSRKLVELNPGFDGALRGRDGVGSPTISNNSVTLLHMKSSTALNDISPLQVFTRLRELVISDCPKLSDLAGLHGMTLDRLMFRNSPVSDLSPLNGMPLQYCDCTSSRVSDLAPLESCQRLATLHVKGTKVTPASVAALQKALPNCKVEWDDPGKAPAATTISKLFMYDPAFPQWMKDVQAMPVQEQIREVSKKLVELNPGFDGKLTAASGIGLPSINDGVITSIGFDSACITDISPLRLLSGLKSFACNGKQTITTKRSPLSDLSPLQGMQLSSVLCAFTEVADLSPLKGMPLKTLHLDGTKVTHLSPLQGMSLDNMRFTGTLVSDLSPLAGMPLTSLYCHHTPIRDVTPLKGCSTLGTLNITATSVAPASVAALQKALPNCKIEWDEPSKPTPK